MPSRIIRESARTSPTLDRLSANAERLFWRLVVTADDHGRFNADPRVILATCFPLRIGRLRPSLIARWLAELAAVDAVRLWAADGRSFGHFPTWLKHQRAPQSRSKFPEPPPSRHGEATVTPPGPDGEATASETLHRESLSGSRESGSGSRESGVVGTSDGQRIGVEGGEPSPQQLARNRHRLAVMAKNLADQKAMP